MGKSKKTKIVGNHRYILQGSGLGKHIACFNMDGSFSHIVDYSYDIESLLKTWAEIGGKKR